MAENQASEILLDDERLRQSSLEELARILQERVADSVDSSARLESRFQAERLLAARCRRLVAELSAINRTPLPQAGRYLEELKAFASRIAQDCLAPANRENPFRQSWERSLRRHQSLANSLEQAMAFYASSQNASSLRQAMMELFLGRCRAAGLLASATSTDQTDRAYELLTDSLELDPGLAAAHYGRGLILAEKKQHRLAADDFLRAVELDSGLASAWRGLGTARRFLHDYPGALAAFDQAVKLDPRSSAALTGRGIVHSLLEDRQSAMLDFNRAVELDPLNTQAYNNLANELWERGEHDRALEYYNRVLEINPRYVQALNNRGNLYRDLKEYDRALADFARALEIDPEHTYAFNNRGNVYADLKQYQQALDDYTRAIELDLDHAEALNNRGIIYTEMGRTLEALGDFSRAIELDPRHAASYTNRAIILSDLGRIPEAVADYNQAISLKPEESANHLNLAELFLVNDRYQELLACLDRADPRLKEEGDRLVLYYLRSIALRMLKLDSRESDLCFERILSRVSYVGWSFDAIDRWLGKAFIEDGIRDQVAGLTQRLKAKTKI